MGEQTKILDGIKILDFSRVYTGPFCTQILADLGAEVYKIESPGVNDNERTLPPFAADTQENTYFLGLNRGKRSMEINLKEEAGKQIIYELAKDMDFVVENFAPGVADKLGIGYEDIKKMKPDIIYLSISAFGQYGPYATLPGYDLMAQAMGGMISVTGLPDQPLRVGASVGDSISGLFGCIGALGALHYRDLTGQGQHIDVAMVDSIFASLENAVPAYTIGGVVPQRYGSRHPNSTPYDVFRCKDGHVCIVATTHKLFPLLCEAMGKPELATDPRFVESDIRMKHVDLITAEVNEWTMRHTVEEVVTILREARVPVAPILDVPAIVNSENTRVRNMLLEYEHPTVGKIRVPGNPIKFGAYEAAAELPPPVKGQHNVEVLQELGYSEERIAEFMQKGVIGDGHITRMKR